MRSAPKVEDDLSSGPDEASSGVAERRRLPAIKLDSSQKEDSGIVLVKVSIPNAGGMLRPGMTGYAKIAGPRMLLGEAYLRLSIRLFAVELWSWIP